MRAARASGRATAPDEKDVEEGSRHGVNGTPGFFVNGNPAWSPDGSRVVLVGGRAGQAAEGTASTDAVVVSVADGQVVPLDDAAAVTWSPDGSWLALTRSSDPTQVEIVAADGSHRHAVGSEVSGLIDSIIWSR